MKAEVGKKYKHYKGNEYQVLAIARNSENFDKELVIYQDCSDATKIWARPKEMFEEDVLVGGVLRKRFTPIEP